ncbi:conserved domain protein [Paraprevotella xylaniphila YIT 11841]|uniref:Conserved domain protein n=1 Tax=Paraprevotella xylaniphila YIT 11841 TaxID=762982 RepID=F3QXT5_9BACT|nr:conserved domain protein [Paraprevotella xylaniphila YIT 11841]
MSFVLFMKAWIGFFFVTRSVFFYVNSEINCKYSHLFVPLPTNKV